MRPPKYRNIPTEVDGIAFASRKEARRYGELRMLEQAGQISALEVHPRFALKVKDRLVCHYVGDFSYVTAPIAGEWIVEDVKSPATRKNPVYRLKFKLMQAIFNITIKEV